MYIYIYIYIYKKRERVIKEQYNPLKPSDAWNLSKKPTFQTLALFQIIKAYVINKGKSLKYQWKSMMPYIC